MSMNMVHWNNDNLQWKITVLQEKLVSLPFLQPQMLHGLSWDRIWPSAVRHRWLTGFTVLFLHSSLCYMIVTY
jgi:hypothetical protein